MAITASIVAFCTDRGELRRAVECVLPEVERLWIVDNSPTDALRTTLPEGVEYIFGHGNAGYGAGHNLAIRQAITQAEFHVVVNPDIYFEKGTIASLAEYMKNNTDVGQLMPRVVYPDGELQYLCKLLPSPMDLIGRRFLPKRWVERRNVRFEMRDKDYSSAMDVPYLSGCFMFMRTEALEKTQGFDERFFMYCEDTDLCRRVGMAGWRTCYWPGATVVHAHKKESYTSGRMLRAHVRSAVQYFNKWGWLFDSYRKRINRSL